MNEEKKVVKRSRELGAMATIEKALESLCLGERSRVLAWAKDKFAVCCDAGGPPTCLPPSDVS